jgi:hypothetical protein
MHREPRRADRVGGRYASFMLEVLGFFELEI